LVYVFILESGEETFLNAKITKQVYGFAYLKYPFKDEHMKAFREYESQAKEQGLGLWGKKGEIRSKQDTQKQEAIIVYITETGSKYHSASCRYLSKSKSQIFLEDEVKRKYIPCSACKPPMIK
jgi:hypothetical protein